jgi:lipid A disaccharide synthetase
MVVMYHSSRLLWHVVGRWLVTTKHLSLVNILAQRELVPEFMPHYGSVEAVAANVAELLGNFESLSRTSGELEELVRPLAQKHAGENVARIIRDMAG